MFVEFDDLNPGDDIVLDFYRRGRVVSVWCIFLGFDKRGKWGVLKFSDPATGEHAVELYRVSNIRRQGAMV